MSKKVELAQKKIRENKLDALLVTNPENLFYLFGYGEDGCAAIISRRDWRFFAPLLYFPEVKKKVTGSLPLSGNNIRQYVTGSRLRKIGCEAGQQTLNSFNSWQQLVKPSRLTGITGLIEELRLIKTAAEIAVISKAAAITDRVCGRIVGILNPGLTEREVSARIDRLIREQGAEPGFKTIVASGPAAACPHHLNTDKKIKSGEMVVLDFGARIGSYHSDLTRTVFMGKPGAKFNRNYDLVKQAQTEAIRKIKAGVSAHTIDDAARRIITKAGLGKYFTHTTGHGVGLVVHEGPRLSNLEKIKLAAGMVVTVEPGVYIPGWGGIRIEDMVLVTRNGCRMLSKSKK